MAQPSYFSYDKDFEEVHNYEVNHSHHLIIGTKGIHYSFKGKKKTPKQPG